MSYYISSFESQKTNETNPKKYGGANWAGDNWFHKVEVQFVPLECHITKYHVNTKCTMCTSTISTESRRLAISTKVP